MNRRKIFLKAVFAVILSCSLSGSFLCGCGRKTVSYLEDGSEQDSEVNGQEAAGENAEQAENASETGADSGDAVCYVYVCGEVVTPGVYTLSQEARIYEAVQMAGGLTEEAEATGINQAEQVSDGLMIVVPSKAEMAAGQEMGQTAEVSDGKVNLNTAAAEELMTLPGIGQSKADAIIAYREENGGFSSPEDIMNIPGIKEGVYTKIKDSIKTN